MIIVQLSGGLGNQMFQYAFGKMLSLKNLTPLYLDDSFYNNSHTSNDTTARSLELFLFDLPTQIVTKKQLNKFTSSYLLIKHIYAKILNYKIVNELEFNYNPSFTILKGNLYLKGYWQSAKYFYGYERAIAKEFVFTKEVNKITKMMLQEIEKLTAIAIHIRRGDYISSAQANKHHGFVGVEYYKAAIRHIDNVVNTPFYFIFSDDPEWAHKNIMPEIKKGKIVMHNTGLDSWQDMYLMSKCKHNIIANSSFSWWAAWLNNNENKIVIAPKKWFNDASINTKDLLPKTWIRI